MRRVRRKTAESFKPKPDEVWDRVEGLYREGLLSNRKIAEECGVSESAVRLKAKAEGWVKGDAHALRERAQQKANDRALPKYIAPSPERIEELAELGANILVRHRTSVATMAGLVQDMVGQLRHQTHHEQDLAKHIESYYMALAAENPLEAGKLQQQCNAALHAIGLNTRSKTMVNLANAAKTLIELERKAWDMDANNDDRSYEDLLAEINAKDGGE